MRKPLWSSLIITALLAGPAIGGPEETRARIAARISAQPELEGSYLYLQEQYRLGVRGYAASDFLRSSDDVLLPYAQDGVISAHEFELAQDRAREASYDHSIDSFLNRLTRNSAEQVSLPFSLRKASGQQSARVRSDRLAAVLRLDQDGDWQVSRSEIDAEALTDKRFKPEDIIRYDLDGDGLVSIPEITAGIDADPDLGNSRAAEQMRALALLDLDRDEIVEKGEVRALLELLEVSVSEGRPGLPQDRMAQALADGWSDRGPWRRQDPPREAPDCGPVAPASDDAFVFVSAYEGTGATNLALDGPGTATSVATLEIEPGEGRIFLLLASERPVLWNLTGDVGRLSRVVVQRAAISEGPGGAGVAGVAADKVSFLARDACVEPIWEYDDRLMPIVVLGPWLAWQRTPSLILATYEMRKSYLPSGHLKSERSFPDGQFDLIIHNELFEPFGDSFVRAPTDRATMSVLQSYWLGSSGVDSGVFFFKPGDVLTSGPEAFHDVMPGAAGLIQLIRDGTLKVLNTDRGRRHLLLTRPIPHLPTGLDTWKKTRVDLAKGVPRPVGEYPGLQVYSLEENRCLTDVTCD